MSDDEDDYLSMAIPEPATYQPETSIQRRKRKEREGEARGRVLSKAEQRAADATAREAALATALDASSSKGAQMMAKLGFKPGDRLGRATNPHALAEPVGLDVKEDRGGIGLDAERKRKVREELAGAAKRVKAEEGDFRERVAREREERGQEGQWRGAMKVAEKLDAEAAEADAAAANGGAATAAERRATTTHDVPAAAPGPDAATKHPTAGRCNLLTRTLARERATAEHERRMRYDLEQSLTRNPNYNDPEEDLYDRLALGTEEQGLEFEEEDDPELDALEALPVAERLDKVVGYLRESYRYCFWCKFRYPDVELEGCPGLTEEEHD